MEIIEKVFADYARPKKLGGKNAALITFAGFLGFTSFQAVFGGSNREHTSIEIEANLRAAEMILLLIVIAVTSYYSVLVGGNLKGIVVGYGMSTGAVALNEAVRTFAGPSFQAAFSTIWSFSYLISLLAWMATLWSLEPNPAPMDATQMDGDYECLAGRSKMTRMRGYLGKAARA
jgi:hypothetical protein